MSALFSYPYDTALVSRIEAHWVHAALASYSGVAQQSLPCTRPPSSYMPRSTWAYLSCPSLLLSTVTHALTAALRGYLDDWYVLVAMMESQLLRGGLDLVRLAYYAQQPGGALRLLADVAAEAARANKSSAGEGHGGKGGLRAMAAALGASWESRERGTGLREA